MPAELDSARCCRSANAASYSARCGRRPRRSELPISRRSCGAHRAALTRFANNAIHQNVAEQDRWLSVRVAHGSDDRARHHQPSRSRFHPPRSGAGPRADALAAPDPDLLPLTESSLISETKRFDAATAAATPERSRARRGRGHPHRGKLAGRPPPASIPPAKASRRSSTRAALPPGTRKPWRSSPSPPWPPIAPAGPRLPPCRIAAIDPVALARAAAKKRVCRAIRANWRPAATP